MLQRQQMLDVFFFDPLILSLAIVIERHIRRRKNKAIKRIVLFWKSLRLQRNRRGMKGLPIYFLALQLEPSRTQHLKGFLQGPSFIALSNGCLSTQIFLHTGWTLVRLFCCEHPFGLTSVLVLVAGTNLGLNSAVV